MQIAVREMARSEVNLVIDYFHQSTSEHLEMLGVDRARLPSPGSWHEQFENLFSTPFEKRPRLYLVWLLDRRVIGFSSCDKIVFGERANMHLHVSNPERRRQGIGTECVLRSVEIYFQKLKLRQLYCEPNGFNAGPNRTLQRAGFKYIRTHMTVSGPLNYHQAVTQWLIER